ncbi:hypothetical protein DPMN_173780 [Dreissena polymorpha]|uniref:Uncharacterized protein n=1 Tax=Dreissena polymorpha TaxID=45954 RepID=A0A9D4E672_DREPO|nr:hypothetical protein DPMN_173780 [Dreissena polymorpha]
MFLLFNANFHIPVNMLTSSGSEASLKCIAFQPARYQGQFAFIYSAASSRLPYVLTGFRGQKTAPSGTIFKLDKDIIEKNVLNKNLPHFIAAKFFNKPIQFLYSFEISSENVMCKDHADWAINWSSRFHEDWEIHVASIINVEDEWRTKVITKATRACHISDGRTDGRTDAQTDGTNYYIPSEFCFGGDYKHQSTLSPWHDWNKLHIIGTYLLTKFHEDQKINVASRVLTRKNAPPPGSHVFQPTSIIFELFQDIIVINLLTLFHEDWIINVASRVLTKKNAPPPGGHVFQPTGIIFELVQDIIETNLLTKFHEDWTENVASRVKNAPSLGSHVFQPKVTIFKLIQDIIGTNHLTNFHEDRKINVASRVLTRKNASPPGGHVCQPTGIIFELFQDIIGMNLLMNPRGCIVVCQEHYFKLDQNIIGNEFLNRIHEESKIHVLNGRIIGTNVLTKFYEDWEFAHLRGTNILVNSSAFGRKLPQPPGSHFHDDWAKHKTAPPPPGSHVIQLTRTIFQLNSRIKETNVLTKFHENWTKNVTSIVFTCFHYIHTEKNAPPTGGHVFLPIWTIFELVRHINKTNVLINSHDDWAKIVTSRVFTRKTAPPTGGHLHEDWALNSTSTVFELDRDIIGTNLLTKFHETRTLNVDGRTTDKDRNQETKVLTKFHENWANNVTSRRKMHRPLAAMFFLPIWTIFELVRGINTTNVLTNFHDDWAKIVTSRVFTRKTAPPIGGHVFQRTGTTFELNQHIIKTNILLLTNFELDRDFFGTKLLTKFHEDRTINVASRTGHKAHLSNQEVSMKSAKALPRYGSGHKSAGRTDGRTDSRTTPKQYPSASGRG